MIGSEKIDIWSAIIWSRGGVNVRGAGTRKKQGGMRIVTPHTPKFKGRGNATYLQGILINMLGQ